jgi:hypothetical protein
MFSGGLVTSSRQSGNRGEEVAGDGEAENAHRVGGRKSKAPRGNGDRGARE